ncbi:MAG: hypothetical protein ACLQUW_02555 [Desulfobaccales bacterium]
MNTPIDQSKRQAVENITNELHKLYLAVVGKEPDPEVVRAEAEYFVAKYGPDADLKEMFGSV